MNALQILCKARSFLARRRWTRFHRAKDNSGVPVSPKSPKAVCFCALGAIDAVSPSSTFPQQRQIAVEYFRDAFGRGYLIGDWNDHPERKKKDVIANFDKAIKIAKRK